MKNKLVRAALSVAVLLIAGASARAAIIDDFTGSLSIGVPALGSNPSAGSGFVATAGAVGGFRSIVLTRTVGTGSPVVTTDLGGDGLISQSTGPADVANVLLQYDGDNNPFALNVNGLGGLNLTTGGTNAFDLAYRADLAGATVDVTVYTSASSASHATFNTAATGFGATPYALADLPFASFTPTLGGGADFSSVGAIEIRINANGISALDLQMDSVQTVVVPEPAALSLLGGLLLIARRRK